VAGFANLPISRKLLAAFAAVIAVIFVSSAILYSRLRVIESAKKQLIHTTEVLDTVQDALEAMLDQQIGVRGYLLTADETFWSPITVAGMPLQQRFEN
jgi:CHASE3 domain sensor protein